MVFVNVLKWHVLRKIYILTQFLYSYFLKKKIINIFKSIDEETNYLGLV